MAHLSVSVLGALQVSVDGHPVTTFRSAKTRALLVYLAMESDRFHTRDALACLLWPDQPNQTARDNLRQTLAILRKAVGDSKAAGLSSLDITRRNLGQTRSSSPKAPGDHDAKPPFLIINRNEIQFNAESDYSLDAAAFDAHLAASHAHLHPPSTTCGQCASRLQQAVDLYRGKFLEQFFLKDGAEFEEWALIRREALHRSVLEALAHLGDYYEQCGDLAKAIRCASRQLELDPWREEAHCQIMRALARNGQRSEALEQYETCRRVLAEELGVEPSDETRNLYAQISQGDWAFEPDEISSISLGSALPLPRTPFIGRERELGELRNLIADPECRLITLVGIGGIGKTRLALEAAEQTREAFADGAVFISLASVNPDELVALAIAEGLGLASPGAREPRDLVLHHVRNKQMLLVLDNLEQLASSVGLFVEILQSAPGIKLLCTSREALHLQSEWVYQVEGLGVPENVQTAKFEAYSAVAVFVQNARRARIGYSLTEEERAGIARIVHLVEGMPLALELAASWSRILSSQEIADQIERDINFLSTSMRDMPDRHRGIRAVFDESWDMLAVEEQRVLSQLSVFQGGWRRHAAEQVARTSLPVLASLLRKSLVRRIETDRYDMHELIRQYSSARLAADPVQEAAARDRHSAYYLMLVEQEEYRLCSDQQKMVLAELAPETANIRLALARAIDLHQIDRLRQVSFPLLYLYEIRGWYREGESLFRDAARKLGMFAVADPSQETSRQIAMIDMQTNQAYFAHRLGRISEAYAQLRQYSEQLRALGDRTVLRYAVRYCGIAAHPLGKLDEAESSLRESRESSQTINRPWDLGIDNVYLGSVLRVRGALDEAQMCLRQALEISRKLGDPRLLAVSLNGLGFVLLALNQPTQARELAEQALSLAQETGNRYDLALSMALLGDVAARLGNSPEAYRLFEKSRALFLETGDTLNATGMYTRQAHLALSMDRPREAESHFRTAARLAIQGGSDRQTINALAGLASALVRVGAVGSAMELVVFVLSHPSSPAAARDLAERLRPDLEAQLTPAQIQAIELRTATETLEGIMQRFVVGSLMHPQPTLKAIDSKAGPEFE